MREMLTREDLAKYPFLRKASSFIEGYGLTLKDLAAPEYSGIVNRAVERVRNSIEGKKIVTDWKDPETEILAYPLALAFVYGLKMEWVISRFAVAEQKRCDELLNMEKDNQKLAEVAEDGFGWKLEPIDVNLEGKKFDFRLGVTEYLEVAPQFHSARWKLVNRYLLNGEVYLKKSEAARLISGSVKNKIIERATEDEIRKFEIPEAFRPHLEELMKLAKRKRVYEEEAPVGLVEEAKPPCIVAIINDLAAGKSLSHMARFTITTFMLNVGEGVDDVLKLFSNVADFDQGKARYQIEHIAGMIGSKTKYKPPKCDVLRSFGLCVGKDMLCDRVWHPMQYYKARAREIAKGVAKDRGGKKTV
jgi:DNA primase large subunit